MRKPVRHTGSFRIRLLALPRWGKQAIVIALDIVFAQIATWVALWLRLDVAGWPTGEQLYVYMVAPALAIPVFVRFGLYRAIFRYTGQAALTATARAVLLYAILFTAVLLWQRWINVPRTLGVLQPLIFLFLVGASRALARFWLSGLGGAATRHERRMLIYGADTAGVQTASAFQVSGDLRLIAFVDDDPLKIGRSINGVPVLAPESVPQWVVRERISDILLALPNLARDRRNAIIASLEDLPVHVRSLPSIADLTSGKVTVQDFRELDIEDLLGREPVPPIKALLERDLAGQVVLVSGAGGSIGAELTRQIVFQRPRQLLLLDHSEFGLYTIHQELQALCASASLAVELVPLLGSVVHAQRVDAICAAWHPATVYHAAAYKHVPMVEDNPGEGVRNNVLGTLNMARAAAACGARRFVLISTDKAVRPTNTMGASKRMAELVLQALAEQQQAHTVFCMVRFGNVLGSSGSVVPLFRRQLAEGGPLTVTHREVTRYFMTIPEAAQLVLQAGAMGQGGDVFVLDMGEPVRIMDLARRMVQLSGLSLRDAQHPAGDVEIAITGLRPGEKLYEELLIGDNPEPTEHPRIMRARESFIPWDALQVHLDALLQAAAANDKPGIRRVFEDCVQGYTTPPPEQADSRTESFP